MNRNQRLILISMYCTLAMVLDYIKSFIPFLNMPSGGSINIALIPIVISSFHLGYTDGILTGLLWWLLSSILGLNPYYISIWQYALDYIIPSSVVGICSIFYLKKKMYEIELGILLMMIIRTLSIVCSGAIFWPDGLAAGSIQAWIASLIYNLPYSIATLIMLQITVPIIMLRLQQKIK